MTKTRDFSMKSTFLKVFKLLVLLILCQNIHAGLRALTIHSRANCFNNESITWWAGHPLLLKTYSFHTRYNAETGTVDSHFIETPKEETWRSAAVHYGEAMPGENWAVGGEHLKYDDDLGEIELLGYTQALDCAIYDGWWE